MIAQFTGSALHIYLCVKFVAEEDMGVRGLGIATFIAYLAMIVIVTVNMHCISAIQDALIWPDKSAFA